MRRINFEVEEELFQRFSLLPWGVRSATLRALTEEVCSLFEKHGTMGIGALLDNPKKNVQILNTSLERLEKK